MGAGDRSRTEIVVRGLWLRYYRLKIQSPEKAAPLENEAVLSIRFSIEEFPEPGGFMEAN